jgi:hypothetical protein
MRASEFIGESSNPAVQSKLWKAQVKIKSPQYTGYIVVTVAAPNMTTARNLIKAMYHAQEYEVGSTTEVK